MARSILAPSAALVCLLVCVAAPAAGKSTSTRGRAHCAATQSSGGRLAASGTRSFRGSRCPQDGGHSRHHGRPAHLLFFTARDGRCPDSGLEPSAANLPQVRAATLCLVNRERAAHGEAPLHWNLDLVTAAQAHTESMAFGGYFEHVGPRGETPLARMRHTGYISSSRVGFEVGENIGWGSLWLGTPRAIVAIWMSSAGHRANILDRRFRDTGIGISPHLGRLAHARSGGIYTQDFGVIVG